jgi:hypothetical protein
MGNTTTPLRSGGLTAGRPTVRKVQFRSGRRMAQEANADGRKAAGNREPLFWRLRQRPRITGRIRVVARPERELTWAR